MRQLKRESHITTIYDMHAYWLLSVHWLFSWSTGLLNDVCMYVRMYAYESFIFHLALNSRLHSNVATGEACQTLQTGEQ